MNVAELQKTILEIGLYIDDLCKRHNITYYLCGGSALGAVRYQGFALLDDDLDIFMTYDNYMKFINVCRTHLDTKRFYLQEENTDEWPLLFTKLRMNGTTYIEEDTKNRKMHKGVYVDIFCLDNAADNNFLYYMQYAFSRFIIAETLGERGYSTKSKLKKVLIFFSRIFIRGFMKRMLLSFIKGFNNKKTKKVGEFFGSRGKFKSISFSRGYLGTPRYVKFESAILSVPEQVEKYLMFRYGDYMKMPDKTFPSHVLYFDLDSSLKQVKEG